MLSYFPLGQIATLYPVSTAIISPGKTLANGNTSEWIRSPKQAQRRRRHPSPATSHTRFHFSLPSFESPSSPSTSICYHNHQFSCVVRISFSCISTLDTHAMPLLLCNSQVVFFHQRVLRGFVWEGGLWDWDPHCKGAPYNGLGPALWGSASSTVSDWRRCVALSSFGTASSLWLHCSSLHFHGTASRSPWSPVL